MNFDKSYKAFFTHIKQQIKITQVKIAVSANQQLLFGYWYIGNLVIHYQKKEGHGSKIFDRLSADIKHEFPDLQGFSVRNIQYMKAFSEQHNHLIIKDLDSFQLPFENAFSKVQPPVALLEDLFLKSIISKITWSHHLILMTKVKDFSERLWYIEETIENGWSKDIMAMQIETKLYQRQIKNPKISNFDLALPKPQSDLAKYLLKDPYIFDFVSATPKANERNIEDQLVSHITKFLLELGQGFAFIGKQYAIEVGNQDFYIDLLFYHIRLRAYVVIELKARDFEPKDAGQINFYVNVVNDKLKAETDNPTIGIILCKGKNNTLAEYALAGMSNAVSVADYQLTKAIPENLRSNLPTIEALENELSDTNLEE